MADGIFNAQIESTTLGIEDHGILTAYLHLRWGGSVQGFGGYSLDTCPKERGGDRVGCAWGTEFILRVLRTVGVSRWEDLPYKYIRAKSVNGLLVAIGHITDDKWFEPAKDLAHLCPT